MGITSCFILFIKVFPWWFHDAYLKSLRWEKVKKPIKKQNDDDDEE
jgi:hypothetical protein